MVVRRRRAIRTRGALIGCVLAAVAFVATRPLAHDAAHPRPMVVESSAQPQQLLPELASCEPDAPLGQTLSAEGLLEVDDPRGQVVAIRAPPEARMVELATLVLSLREAGAPLQIEGRRTLVLDTWTRGRLVIHPRCVRTLELTPERMKLETWGQLAASLE